MAKSLRTRALVIAVALMASVLTFAPPAAAETDPAATASISGLVTNRDGEPIPDATVWLYKRAGHSSWGNGMFAQANQDGTYSFEALGPGTYTLQFVTPSRYPLRGSEYWSDKPGLWTADLIEVAEGSEITGIDASVGPDIRVSGRVTDYDRMPLTGVHVTLRYASGATFEAVTDASGFYVLDDVDSGTAIVRFDPPAESGIPTQWYFEAYSRGDARGVTITSHGLQIDAAIGLPRVAGSIPVIAGRTEVGSTLTAIPGEWTSDAELTFQWFADDAPIAGAVADTLDLSPSLLSKSIRVSVTGSKPGFTALTTTSSATGWVAPGTLTGPQPVITGNVAVGSTVGVSLAGWSTGATFSYQWYVGSSAIAGATTSTLRLTSAHRDKPIQVMVTASKSGYTTTSQISTLTGNVVTAGQPTIVGTARVGATLKAAPGTWAVDTVLAYQWCADGQAIRGATRATFVPTNAEDGKALTVIVRGAKPTYATVTVTSPATRRVVRAGTPTIAGSRAVGSTLTAKPGAWTGGTSFTYQWYANGTSISNATKSTYRLTAAQKAKKITVKVTGTKSGFTTVSMTSAATAKVATAATPKISGTRKVGKKLTVSHGTWTSGTTFSYQWYANGVTIKGATKSTYTLKSAQKGEKITVKVTGRKSGYATVSKTSAATGKIG